MNRFRRCLCAALIPLAMALVAAASQAASQKKSSPVVATAEPAAPGAPQTLGKADSWTAYATRDTTGKVCYVMGQPQRTEPSGFNRKQPMAMVTHRAAEKISNVVSFVAGYPLREGSDVTLDVGGNKFELFTKEDSAWARTAELDKTIVSVLAKGHQAVVKGLPAKGPATTDVYPLAGFAKTLALIDKACGVSRGEKAKPAAATPRHRARKKTT